jgi:hypothetical protein
VQLPSIMQRVKVHGREGVFLVFEVYPSLQVADIAPLGREYMVERAVLFESLEPVEDDADPA